jgi:hypothetical protein
MHCANSHFPQSRWAFHVSEISVQDAVIFTAELTEAKCSTQLPTGSQTYPRIFPRVRCTKCSRELLTGSHGFAVKLTCVYIFTRSLYKVLKGTLTGSHKFAIKLTCMHARTHARTRTHTHTHTHTHTYIYIYTGVLCMDYKINA